MTLSTHILALLIGLVYPTYLYIIYKKTNNQIKKDDYDRLKDYKQTIFIFWLQTCLIIVNLFIDKSEQLNFFPTFNTFGIIMSILILVFIGLQIYTSKIPTIEKAQSVIERMKGNYYYLPKSKQEFIWFNFLSLSAGICEEIIFRLFMFSYFLENTNLILAFALTNIIFALTHISSTKENIIGAFILGLLFTAIYYFSNNIWLAIILHIAIDVSIGYMGYYAYKLKKDNN
ncbi:type II CAAX endopeptidase family protein [Yeosuana sp. MJ-SS3]|uniref:Type II CAAX endopeptidase family protein n=1 Tax=Gilvirhabdus luticola TaxID=3079858 RepID=A0ABU3U6I7_9FLAO|nr:type II CAAX endopeptidase family protein [Yeosuana sp. MJ-SS3]MDU8885942.1 type II CAAX endopeptidase family protein [Yeosuana sp. MJ-SS3]